MLLFPILPKA